MHDDDDGQIGPTTCKTLDQGSWKIYSLDQRTFMHPSIHPFSRSGILCDFNHVLYVLFNTPFKAKGKCITAGFGGQTSSHPHSRSAGGGRFPVNVMSRLSGVCDTQMAGLSSGPDGHQQ